MFEVRSQIYGHFVGLMGYKDNSLEEEGKQFRRHDFGCPCQLSNPQERDPNALFPCCSAFLEHLPIFPIPLTAR